MTYFELRKFIVDDMRMSHVYQPVMLAELLMRGGVATTQEIAQAILQRDPTQVEFYEQVVKSMVGRVLTRNRGITERNGGSYRLKDAESFTSEQAEELIQLCFQRINDYEAKRGEVLWEHRRRGHRPISGSTRYQVLKRARGRCELCGASAEEKRLEVDHIVPKSLGGADDLSNYQALCYSCNAAKRNADDTDFRAWKHEFDNREDDCPFCSLQDRAITETTLAFVLRDKFAVTKGHSLIIPKRHVRDYFGMVQPEVNAVNDLLRRTKRHLECADSSIEGFNIGINNGEVSGQTIFHCHIHLVPRRRGDVENPRGGVRNVIPGLGDY